jgi:hypothetical protein
MCKQSLILSSAIVVAANLCASYTARAGVSYADPAGGWRYTYAANPFIAGTVNGGCVGGVCPDGYGLNQIVPDALDGTWSHNQGDKWDGSAPGVPLGDYHAPPTDPINNPRSGNQGPAPGGAGIFNESGTSYIRIQDAGNPEDTNPADTFYNGYVQDNLANPNGPDHPINTNRRVYFGHPVQQDGALADELILTNTGVTLSFRARIPGMEHASDLDDIHQQDTDLDGNLSVTPWFQGDGTIPAAPNGRGAPMLNGRGTINIVQNAPDNVDTSVGFSLVTSHDIDAFCGASSGSLCTGSGSGGLIMNNLNGNTPTNVDSVSAGTLNIVEMEDEELNEWHEFWITMQNNGALAGNIEVKVYMDGDVSSPSTFQVTLAGAGNAVYANENDPWLELGFSFNAEWGSIDVDFLSYALGVIAPTPGGLPGDYNDDGKVDAADYVAWRKGGTLANDDSPGTGPDDYDRWVTHFGSMASGGGGSAGSIPEPTAAVILSMAAVVVSVARRARDCKRLFCMRSSM